MLSSSANGEILPRFSIHSHSLVCSGVCDWDKVYAVWLRRLLKVSGAEHLGYADESPGNVHELVTYPILDIVHRLQIIIRLWN